MKVISVRAVCMLCKHLKEDWAVYGYYCAKKLIEEATFAKAVTHPFKEACDKFELLEVLNPGG